MHPEFIVFPISIITMITMFYFKRQWHLRKTTQQLAELNEAPFKFRVVLKDGNEYVVFDLNDGLILWCEFGFGVDSDGMYGIDDLTLRGLNTSRSGDIELKIGQSVFPIFIKMEAFTEWANTKTFKIIWDRAFKEAWDDMKKKINNLRYLEAKSKEKEKKK